jgi:Protein of unknown function (DUF3892)
MVRSLQILCSTKDHRLNPYQCVTHIGGVNEDGSPWRLSIAEAVDGIRARQCEFYVVDSTGEKVWVHITVSRDGHEYLKALADGEVPYMLMGLPACGD